MGKVINFYEGKARIESKKGINNRISLEDYLISNLFKGSKENNNEKSKYLYDPSLEIREEQNEQTEFFREPICVEPKTIDQHTKDYFDEINKFTLERNVDGCKSLIIIDYQEVMLRLVQFYGIDNLKAFYMKPDNESFNRLMEILNIKDIEYSDLSESELTKYDKLITQLIIDDQFNDC